MRVFLSIYATFHRDSLYTRFQIARVFKLARRLKIFVQDCNFVYRHIKVPKMHNSFIALERFPHVRVTSIHGLKNGIFTLVFGKFNTATCVHQKNILIA